MNSPSLISPFTLSQHTPSLFIGVPIARQRAAGVQWKWWSHRGPPPHLMICHTNVISGSLWSAAAQTGKRMCFWLPVGAVERQEVRRHSVARWLHHGTLFYRLENAIVDCEILSPLGPVLCCSIPRCI